MDNKSRLIVALVVGLAVVASAWLLAKGIRHFRSGDPRVNVTGIAERNITSDLIVWRISVEATNEIQAQAFAQLDRDASTVLSYLRGAGIASEDISVSNTNVSKLTDGYYDRDKDKYISVFKGYQFTQDIVVSSSRIDEVEAVYRKISELYNQGLTFSAHAPLYYYTKLNELKMEMLREASADAYARASIIAEGGKASLGKLESSSMGVFQIVGLNSNEEYSWGGTFNTSSKLKTASVTVRTSYQLK